MRNPGSSIGRYRIIDFLGRGGMGAVYLASHIDFEEARFAVKQLHQNGVGTQSLDRAVAQFRSEAAFLARLEHPQLVSFADFFEHDGDYFLVMSYVEGKTLEQVSKDRGPLPVARVLEWAFQLCEVLEYLHTQSPAVLFRDLKPSNVMLRTDGRLCLIDFGIARLFEPDRETTNTFLLGVGSPGYAPLEQYRGSGSTDPRSDIYALGATLYHLLSGRPPQCPVELATLGLEPTSLRRYNSEVSPTLEAVLFQMMALRPADRPVSVTEVASQLRWAASIPQPNDVETELLYEDVAPSRRLSRWGLPAATLLLLGGLLGLNGALQEPTQPLAASPPRVVTLEAAAEDSGSPVTDLGGLIQPTSTQATQPPEAPSELAFTRSAPVSVSTMTPPSTSPVRSESSPRRLTLPGNDYPQAPPRRRRNSTQRPAPDSHSVLAAKGRPRPKPAAVKPKIEPKPLPPPPPPVVYVPTSVAPGIQTGFPNSVLEAAPPPASGVNSTSVLTAAPANPSVLSAAPPNPSVFSTTTSVLGGSARVGSGTTTTAGGPLAVTAAPPGSTQDSGRGAPPGGRPANAGDQPGQSVGSSEQPRGPAGAKPPGPPGGGGSPPPPLPGGGP